MSKPNTPRVIPRVARFAIASGGVYVLLSLTAQQADAATGGLLPGLTDVAGSIVTSATGSVTGSAPAVAQAPAAANQAVSAVSAGLSRQSAALSQGQALPPPAVSVARAATGTAAATVTRAASVTQAASITAGATVTRAASVTPTVSTTSQAPAPAESAAVPASRAAAPTGAAVSHSPAPVTGMVKIRAMSNTAKASAPAAAEPAPVVPAALTRPPATPIKNPIADILAPFTGMPPWLVDILLATGLVVAAAYGTEPVLVLARRRRQRGGQSTQGRG